MSAILKAFAFIGLIATTCASVDYSETALENTFRTKPNKVNVQLINEGTEVKFTRARKPDVDAVNLLAELSSNSENVCGNSLGIKMGDENFCGISLLGFEVNQFRSSTQIKFSLLFGSVEDQFLLEVPVFSTPSQFDGKQKELTAWAAEENLGVKGPIDSQDLKKIMANVDITVKFEWLKNLLTFGILKSDTEQFVYDSPPVYNAFVSRPVILPPSFIDEMIKVVDSLKDGTDYE